MAYLRTEIRLGMDFQYYRDCSIAIGISTVLAKNLRGKEIRKWQSTNRLSTSAKHYKRHY